MTFWIKKSFPKIPFFLGKMFKLVWFYRLWAQVENSKFFLQKTMFYPTQSFQRLYELKVSERFHPHLLQKRYFEKFSQKFLSAFLMTLELSCFVDKSTKQNFWKKAKFLRKWNFEKLEKQKKWKTCRFKILDPYKNIYSHSADII